MKVVCRRSPTMSTLLSSSEFSDLDSTFGSAVSEDDASRRATAVLRMTVLIFF